MKQQTIDLSGTVIAYTVHEHKGAPTLILLHGFGEDGRIWVNQIPTLNKHFRVIVPDLPGSGNSPHNDAMMDIDAMAELVHQLAGLENAGKHILFGHSMGGYITLACAEKHPGELLAFGLVHSTAYADNEEKIAARRKGIAFAKEHGAEKFLAQVIPNLFTKKYVQQGGDWVNILLGRAAAFKTETLVGYYEAMIRRPDRTEVLKKAAVPVLFVSGREDTTIPVQHMLEQCHLPDISYFHTLEQSAHMGMLEEPGEMNEIINTFLISI